MFCRVSWLIVLAALAVSAQACVGNIADTNGGRGNAPDDGEGFPSSLLEPYTGTLHITYDNTFINYEQLRGKVRVIFDDAWVRDGVDQFAEHIGPLGGADFVNRFIDTRAATSDFLLSLDALSKDVCAKAVADRTGPFAGVDVTTSVVDIPPSTTTTYQAEDPATFTSAVCNPSATEAQLCANGTISMKATPFATTERYRISVRARATAVDSIMDIRVGSRVVRTVSPVANAATYYTVDVDAAAGELIILAFTNDGRDVNNVDRNLSVDSVTVEGPLTPSTGNARETAARDTVKALYQKITFRTPSSDELTASYTLVKDLQSLLDDQRSAWSGVCEALVRSPDFTFTLPPSRATASGAERDVLLLVKLAADLVARAPTRAEVDAIANGSKTIDEQIDDFMASDEFRNAMFYRMRLRTESTGSELGDEAARLWTYLLTTGATYEDLLTGTYNVDTNYQQVERPAHHGRSGVLTMKGYISGKPSLPHYNYSARVLGDFMGVIFEVPDEVVTMRLGSTATSTVDPNSLCFSCHRLLTPLAYQRRRWTDQGDYIEVDDSGIPIEQTDGDVVESYPYKGDGMEAFGLQAVRKEQFLLQTVNAEVDLLLRRRLRSNEDERVIYKQLFDELRSSGDLRKTLKILLASPQYRGELEL